MTSSLWNSAGIALALSLPMDKFEVDRYRLAVDLTPSARLNRLRVSAEVFRRESLTLADELSSLPDFSTFLISEVPLSNSLDLSDRSTLREVRGEIAACAFVFESLVQHMVDFARNHAATLPEDPSLDSIAEYVVESILVALYRRRLSIFDTLVISCGLYIPGGSSNRELANEVINADGLESPRALPRRSRLLYRYETLGEALLELENSDKRSSLYNHGFAPSRWYRFEKNEVMDLHRRNQTVGPYIPDEY